jgi:hypothetical protein
MARLRQPDTGLRASADPSLLVQSLLDLIVDSAVEVVDAFHEKLLQLEYDVLLKANIKVVERRAYYSPCLLWSSLIAAITCSTYPFG